MTIILLYVLYISENFEKVYKCVLSSNCTA